jgi:hypothetical protein
MLLNLTCLSSYGAISLNHSSITSGMACEGHQDHAASVTGSISQVSATSE